MLDKGTHNVGTHGSMNPHAHTHVHDDSGTHVVIRHEIVNFGLLVGTPNPMTHMNNIFTFRGFREEIWDNILMGQEAEYLDEAEVRHTVGDEAFRVTFTSLLWTSRAWANDIIRMGYLDQFYIYGLYPLMSYHRRVDIVEASDFFGMGTLRYALMYREHDSLLEEANATDTTSVETDAEQDPTDDSDFEP